MFFCCRAFFCCSHLGIDCSRRGDDWHEVRPGECLGGGREHRRGGRRGHTWDHRWGWTSALYLLYLSKIIYLCACVCVYFVSMIAICMCVSLFVNCMWVRVKALLSRYTGCEGAIWGRPDYLMGGVEQTGAWSGPMGNNQRRVCV